MLLVEHSPLLMEQQPPGASCWGDRHAAADEAQLVAMAGAIAGGAEESACQQEGKERIRTKEKYPKLGLMLLTHTPCMCPTTSRT